MCTATEASEEVLALDVWVDDRSVLQLDKDAAIAGTCWGSCAVAVDEMRKLRARRVANSVAIGAMVVSASFLLTPVPDDLGKAVLICLDG